MKKTKEVKFRHKFIIKTARLLLQPFLKVRYKYKSKYYKELKKKGPFLVIANHVVSSDVLLLGLSFPFNLYYFATENLFNLGILSKLLVYAANPIKKTKSKSDLGSIKKAIRISKQGGSIAVFPEGNLTYTGETNHFSKSLVKMIRLLKLPVILFKFEGLYLSNPRWSNENKKGRSEGYITKIIEYEQYKEMADEELYNIVYGGIYSNAYNNATNSLFEGKKLAEGLQRLIFMDLKKNIPFVTYSKDDKLYSKVSDYELTYQSDGYVKDKNGKLETLINLDKQIKKAYYHYYHNNDIHYENESLVNENIKRTKQKLGKFITILNKDSIILKSNKEIALTFNFADVNEIAIQGKNKLIIYYLDKTYLLVFDKHASMYAHLLTYQFYKEGKIYDENRNVFTSFGLH